MRFLGGLHLIEGSTLLRYDLMTTVANRDGVWISGREFILSVQAVHTADDTTTVTVVFLFGEGEHFEGFAAILVLADFCLSRIMPVGVRLHFDSEGLFSRHNSAVFVIF